MDTSKGIKYKRKSKRTNIKGIEYYSGLIFKMLGALFLLSGFYFYLGAEGGLLNMISHLLSASSNSTVAEADVSVATLFKLLYGFLPAVLISVGCFCFYKRYGFLTRLFSLLSAVYFIVFQNFFFYSNYLSHIGSYSGYIIPTLALYIPVVLMFIGYRIYKKGIFLYLSALYFYSFVFGLWICWFNFAYTLGSILLFNLTLFGFSVKLRHYRIIFINCFIAYSFLFLFVIRKFYANHFFSFTTLFFIVSLLYFLVFCIISGVLAYKEQKFKYILFNWLNILSFVLLTCFVLFLIGRPEYYFYPVSVALLSYIIAYFLLVKNKIDQNIHIVELTIVFLTSALVSSFFNSFSAMFFISLNSLLFMSYGKYRNNKLSVYVSVLFSVFLALYFVFISLSLYLPLLIDPIAAGSLALASGLGYSFIFLVALSGIVIMMKKVDVSLSHKWFVRKKYLAFLNVFLLSNLFLCLEFGILLLFAGSKAIGVVDAHRATIIVGCLFLLFLLQFPLKGKKMAYYFAYFCSIVLFVANSFGFPYGIEPLFVFSKFFLTETILHYSVLLSGGMVFAISAYSLLNLRNVTKFVSRFIQTTFVFMLLLIVCREYDFFTVLINYYTSDSIDANLVAEIMVDNQHLPYTIIILLVSVLLLLAGSFNNDRFLRLFALFIIGLSFVKMFFLEFELLREGERIASLITVGGVLLLVSSIYTKMKNKERVRTSRVSSKRL